MKNIRILAIITIACMMQIATNTVQAQCSNITLTPTSTASVCYNDGTITVTIGGSDVGNLRLTDAEIALTAIGGGGQSVGFSVWESLSSNVKIYRQAIKGSYTVSFRAFCQTTSDWYESAAQGTVVVGGTYDPLVVNISTARKSMTCRPTGEVKINLSKGKAPFSVTISTPPGLTAPAPFNINPAADTTLSLGNLCPTGTYSVTVVDACGYTASSTHNSPAVANDVPQGLYPYLVRTPSSTNCRTVQPYSTYALSDPDENYYWSNSGTYFEYCYLWNNTGTKVWKPLTTKSPTDTLPANYSTYCNPTQTNLLYSYVRPIGCTVETSTNHTFASYICATGVSITQYDGSTCDSVTISASISSIYAYCYPIDWKITPSTDTSIAIQFGSLSNNGGNMLIYNTTSKNYARGKSYTIVVKGFDGEIRTTTFSVPASAGATFTGTYTYSASTNSCYIAAIFIYQNAGIIAAGTRIKYVSGPVTTLPCGLSTGNSYTIPSGWNSSSFYPSSPAPNGSSTIFERIPHGTYMFEITNSCGTVIPLTINMPAYDHEPLTYTTEHTCGEGLKVYPSGRIMQTSYNGTVSPITGYYNIVSGPSGVTFSTARVATNTVNGYLTLPVPGTYTIGLNYYGYPPSGCDLTTTTVTFPAQGLYIDPELTAAYSCDLINCMVRVQAINGVLPYTYTLSTDPSSPTTPVITPITNNTGVFQNVGVVNGKYIVRVRDACNTNFDLPITILDLSHAHILYTSNSVTTYCNGAEIELNCVALGATQYEWRDPSGTVISYEQRPRPIANYPLSAGKYTVIVTPEGCSTPITDTIELGVLEGPPSWVVPNPNIVLCQNSGNKNIVDSSGIVAAAGCTLLWYNSATSTTPISAPTVFPTSTLGTTTYYVSQKLTSTGCETERKTVEVTVNPAGTCVCTNPAVIAFSPSAPTSVCTISPLSTTVSMSGATYSYSLSLSANAGGSISPTGILYANSSVTYTPVSSDIGKTITVTATTNNPGAPCTATTGTWTFTIAYPTPPTNTNIPTPQAMCYGQTLSNLSVTGVTVKWYTSNIGGTELPGTTVLNTNTTYYAATVSGSCESSLRWGVQVTSSTPAPSGALTSLSFCGATTVNGLISRLTNDGYGSNIKIYNSATATSTMSGTTALVHNTKYYASQTVSSCESIDRLEITALINSVPTSTPNANNETRCGSGSVTLNASGAAAGEGYRWYDAATGGNLLSSVTPYTPNITAGATATYYLAIVNTTSGCESSAGRIAVTATAYTIPSVPTTITTPQAKCYGQTLADITVPSGITVNWYSANLGGSPLASTTALAVTTYYAAAVSSVGGCESARTPIQITASTPPISITSASLCTPATVSSLISELGSNCKVYVSSTATTAMNPGDAITTGTYYVSRIVSGCESFVRTAVTVTVTSSVTPSLNINVTPN